MPVAQSIREAMTRSSWIRKMFERGAELTRQYGAAQVFDFTLGNPFLEPPAAFFDALAHLSRRREEGLHRYMPNAGFPAVREAIAGRLVQDGIFPQATPNQVVMSVGAAGGLNVILKTILNPGEEVILLAPYFAEYVFYVANHGGLPRIVETSETFDLDPEAIAAAIGPQTRAIILNSPNNPTGRLYRAPYLEALAAVLRQREAEIGHPIYLIADDPYRELVYVNDGPRCAASFHDNSFLVYSWSKSLSVAGERIGYIAVNPKADDPAGIVNGLTFANRTLGFVNAPAAMQLAVVQLMDVTIDIGWYRRRRDRLVAALDQMGVELLPPDGTFYLFPRSPLPDDLEFVNRAIDDRVLLVPGTGFGRPGYFRLSYSVDDHTLEAGIEALGRVVAKVRG